MRRMWSLTVLAGVGVLVTGLAAAPGAFAQTSVTESLVNTGSVGTAFPQNKQNEPAVAVDPNHPSVVAAGSNDEIDLAPCGKGTATTASPCPFTPGVGVSGVYFSSDSGKTWTQPTYTGWSARTGPSQVGPIGTLPLYYENGLVSGGDPGLAFGPVPEKGKFSWSNGSRLYYSNLVSNFPGKQAFKGFEAVAVSRTDNVSAAAAGDQSAWEAPVIASKQNMALFSDKSQIWADDAASSKFFGNVYVCYAAFRGVPGRSEPLFVARSTDGGSTWSNTQVTYAAAAAPQRFGQTGCTIRTDSHGTVYVFYMQFTTGLTAYQDVVKSSDGGVHWSRPQRLFAVNDMFYKFDPVEGRYVFDGNAGTREDLGSTPSVSIANGAPTGAGATNEIVDAWSDGRDGLNSEKTLLSWSTDGAKNWHTPVVVSRTGDRSEFSAPAIAPNGSKVYVTYLGWSTTYQDTTAIPREMFGVFRTAAVNADGTPGTFDTLNAGAAGDGRASSANSLSFEFIGDYVYTAATDTYGIGVWTDARNATDCPKVDAYRQSLYTSNPLAKPNPATACTTGFGNTDIFDATTAAP